jgi:tetratricopeptide (TPR) repeat protein
MSSQQTLKALRSRSPTDSARSWLGHILEALPTDGEADEQLLDELLRGVNGPLADEQRHLEEDPDAYRWFWRSAAERLPSQPLARAALADTLLLTGDTDAAIEEMLRAFEANPLLIYRMSGEYRDLMERAGPHEWAAYRALTIRAAALDDPEGQRDYIEDETKDLLDDVGDDRDLRREVLRILRP